VSTRRKALQPFQLSDGTQIRQGEWICSAAKVIGSSPAHFQAADEFHGFRFVEPAHLVQALGEEPSDFGIVKSQETSEFTEISDWQLWGTGRGACPGRWYASAITKTILTLFIQQWDAKLVDPDAKRHFSWRTFIYPYSSVKVEVAARA
jgi:cytochrome P450